MVHVSNNFAYKGVRIRIILKLLCNYLCLSAKAWKKTFPQNISQLLALCALCTHGTFQKIVYVPHLERVLRLSTTTFISLCAYRWCITVQMSYENLRCCVSCVCISYWEYRVLDTWVKVLEILHHYVLLSGGVGLRWALRTHCSHHGASTCGFMYLAGIMVLWLRKLDYNKGQTTVYYSRAHLSRGPN